MAVLVAVVDALFLKYQEAKAFEELRSRHAEDKGVSIGSVRREGERQCLNEVDALAEDSTYVVVVSCTHRVSTSTRFLP